MDEGMRDERNRIGHENKRTGVLFSYFILTTKTIFSP